MLLIPVGAAAAAVLLIAAPSRAEPPPAPSTALPGADDVPMMPDARTRYDRGVKLTGEERFADAAREFQTAYELEPRRESLFAWAQVLRLGGDCRAAMVLYKKFLAVAASTQEAEAATLGMRRCERAPPVVSGPPHPALAISAAPRTRRGGLVTAALLAGGAVLLGTGAALFFAAAASERTAGAALRWDAYHGALERARLTQGAAIGFTVAGVSVGAVGVMRLLLGGRSPPEGDVALWTPSGGAGLGWKGVF